MSLKRSSTKNIVFLFIGCAILAGMIWKIGAKNIYLMALDADPFLLVSAFFFNLLAIFIKAHRWSKLFTLTKSMNSWKVYLIGMAVNQTMPTGSGELTRAYIAKSKLNIPVEETLAPVMIERLADTTFIVGMSATGLTFLTFGNGYNLQMVIPFIILFLGYLLLLKPHFLDKLALIIEGFYEGKDNFLNRVTKSISYSLKTFRGAIVKFNTKNRVIYIVILLTIMSWFVYGIGMYVLLLAFGYNLPIIYVLAITALSEVIGTFSFLPGGLGAKDISFAALLTTLEVPIQAGMSAFLILRIIVYIQIGIGAFISLISLTKTHSIDINKDNETLQSLQLNITKE